jgi:HSP20 family protein
MAETRSDREQKQNSKEDTASQRLITQGREGQMRRRSSSDYATNPFEMMRRLTEQMFGPLVTPGLRGLVHAADDLWIPSVEVLERDGKLVVRADLPGMSKDDVRVEVRDDNLIIEGERKKEMKEDREGYFVTERTYGKFYRAIPLPEGVNADSARATFRDGVLELTIDAPKNNSRTKTIPIDESRQSDSSR